MFRLIKSIFISYFTNLAFFCVVGVGVLLPALSYLLSSGFVGGLNSIFEGGSSSNSPGADIYLVLAKSANTEFVSTLMSSMFYFLNITCL